MPFDLEQSNRMGAIACFLAAQGSDIHHMNHSGVSPYSGCPNKTMAQLLSQHYQEPGFVKQKYYSNVMIVPIAAVFVAVLCLLVTAVRRCSAQFHCKLHMFLTSM